MKRKYYILGFLATLCLLGTSYYAWTLYDAHRKQVTEWNEGAKAAFEEALWLEVNKRAEVPIYYVSSGEEGMITLKTRIPDSVSVMTVKGWRRYKIARHKYENSLTKETKNRGNISVLFEKYPLSIDSLSFHWNRILCDKQIPVNNRIRYVYTDLDLRDDTLYSSVGQQLSRMDSLTVKYMGFRCEHAVTAYVSYPYCLDDLAYGDWCILMFPWLLLVLLFIAYPKLEVLAKRKMVYEKVIERTVEKEIVVNTEVHVMDVQMDKVGIFQLPDGTVFDSVVGLLKKHELQQRLQPQSVSLLKLFLSNEGHQISSEEICMKLWNDTGYSYRLHSAISRLRSDLKAVKSELFVSNSYGLYELKMPISSKNHEN